MRNSLRVRAPLALLGRMIAFSILALGRSAGADPGLVAWTKLPTETPGPDVQNSEPVVWDPNSGRLLYIPPEEPTLWSLTPSAGTGWSGEPTSGPVPGLRFSDRAVFDATRNRVLLFGGRKFNSGGWVLDNETWELSLGPTKTWRQLSPAGQAPPPRVNATVVFDSITRRLLLFGGENDNAHIYNDVYALSVDGGDGAWQVLIADGQPGSPSARLGASAIFDPLRRRMVLFGGDGFAGFDNEVWALSLDTPSPTWQLVPTSGAPSARCYSLVAYDAANDRMIVHGGADPFGSLTDAAALPFAGPPTWTPLPSSEPMGLFGYDLGGVYEPASQRILIPYRSNTRSLDLAPSPQWSMFERHVLPQTQAGAALASGSRTLVVTGGHVDFNNPPFVETWTLDLSNAASSWVRLEVSGGPQDRSQMAMVWDPVRARFLAFGGVNAGTKFNDLWSLTLSPPAWTAVATGGTTPNPGYGWRGVYDPSGDRLVFLSFDIVEPCCTYPTYTNAIFELPLSGPAALQWSRHDVFPASFHMRTGASFTYDAGRDVAWIYGGQDSTLAALSDVWRVDLAGVPTASKATTVGTAPVARAFHAAMFDPIRDRLLVFGGESVGPALDDSWVLDVGAGNLWEQLAPAGGPPPPARSFTASAYDAAADRFVVFGGSGNTGTLDDTWALSLSPPLGVDPGPPVAGRLALAPRGSNPVSGAVVVSVSLPAAGFGSLDLLDVGGRLVRSVRTDGLSAGTHALMLARGEELRPGIYFVRLRHAGDERGLRLAVLR